ncbi:hypothetical protein [Ferrimonas aestuarii]|nr:hypothetical protein [Ferrimonas aestuarii]
MKRILISLVGAAMAFSATAQEQTDYFGVAIGAPGMLNLVYKSDAHPFQASAGYLDRDIWGAEVGYQFYKDKGSTLSSAQVIAGHMRLDLFDFFNDGHIEWNYIGVSTTFKTGGFYFEPSVVIGDDDIASSNPAFWFQAGYLFSF